MSGSDDEFSDFSSLSSSQQTHSSYSSFLSSALRQNLHKVLIPYIQLESQFIASLQKRWRSPFWDKYFVYTSSLGTHTFFMILLPAVFFFGFDVGGDLGGNREMGMGLVMIMGLGVYASSFVKDLVCSPRPFAPPVTRLTLGNHHLEYGFPSTHSTNAVSIALFFYGYVYNLFHPSLNPSNPLAYYFLTTMLIIYTLSIVLGRIYTAMHSVMDCFAGCVLGAIVWWVVTDVPVRFGFGLGVSEGLGWTVTGFGASRKLQAWVIECVANPSSTATFASRLFQSSLSPPFLLTSIFLLIINQHPQPIDDCPCFEDAVAMGAVVYGSLVGIWGRVYFAGSVPIASMITSMAASASTSTPIPMLGAPWTVLPSGTWVPTISSLSSLLLLLSISLLKLTLGISLIFIWRLLAKFLLGITLPPIFRAVARALSAVKSTLDWGLGEMGVGRGERGRWTGWLGMPNRRFYLPATEYRGGVPNLLSPSAKRAGAGLEGGVRGVRGVGEGAEDAYAYEPYGYNRYEAYGGSEDEEEGRVVRPIPSVIDLPSSLRVGVEDMRLTSRVGRKQKQKSKSKSTSWRESKNKNGKRKLAIVIPEEKSEEKSEASPESGMRRHRHYDADVLTKVIVYSGIAILSIELTPRLFEIIGWGVWVGPPPGALVDYGYGI